MKVMRKNFGQLYRFLIGDWWHVITNGNSWGVYHPIKWHIWSYGLTFDEAKLECRKRNRRKK